MDNLIDMYINRKERINTQFTIRFNKSRLSIQLAVIRKIEELGLKPYKPKMSSKCVVYQRILLRLKRKIDDIEEELQLLRNLENYYNKKLVL
jgi:hypothetical protein